MQSDEQISASAALCEDADCEMNVADVAQTEALDQMEELLEQQTRMYSTEVNMGTIKHLRLFYSAWNSMTFNGLTLSAFTFPWSAATVSNTFI